MRGAAVGPLRGGPGPGVGDAAAGAAPGVQDRVAVAAVDARALPRATVRAGQAVGVGRFDEPGGAGPFVRVVDQGGVHGGVPRGRR